MHLDWAWQEHILDKYELKYFKASELEHGVGEFRKFRDDPSNTDARFSAREKALFTEIKTRSVDLFLDAEFLVGFGAVVVLPDYNRLLEEFKIAGFVLPQPYWFAAQVVYMEAGFVMKYLNEGEPESRQAFVSPVYDSHEEYPRRAERIFEEYREKNPLWSKWLLSPRYENDQDYIVLQVADNLVYEMRKLVIKNAFNEIRAERIAMTRLKQRIEKVYKLNYDTLKAIMNRPANLVEIKAEISNPLPTRKAQSGSKPPSLRARA